MISKKQYIFLLVSLFVCVGHVSAQDLSGSFSNYSGSRSLIVNPAGLSTSNVYFDVGLSASFNFSNNFLYLEGTDFTKYVFHGFNKDYWPSYDLGDNFYRYQWYKHAFKISGGTDYKKFKSGVDFNVFSMMYNITPKQTIAVTFNNRMYLSGDNIPYEVAEILSFSLYEDGVMTTDDGHNVYYRIPRTKYFKNYSSEDTKVSALEWSEIGLAYSATVYDRYTDKFDVGVTAKYLIGYSGGAYVQNHINYDLKSADSTYVNSVDAEFAYAYNYDYDHNGFSYYHDKLKSMKKTLGFGGKSCGTGFGFDIGFVYTKKRYSDTRTRYERPCEYPSTDYEWKIGVSVVDLGFIKFNSHATTRRYTSDDTIRISNSIIFGDQMEKMDDVVLTDFFNDLSYHCYGDSTASNTGTSFTMGLPTALSLQFDWNVRDNYYVGAIWMQPIRLQKYSVVRAAQLLLTPRYETRRWELTVPITFIDYNRLYLGVSARYSFFTIGTQNLLNIVGIGKTYGANIYFGVKFNLYKGHCLNEHDVCWSYSEYKRRK